MSTAQQEREVDEVIDVNRVAGDVHQIAVRYEDGEMDIKNGSALNELLYVHELYDELQGGGVTFESMSGDITVRGTTSDDVYAIEHRGEMVETMPDNAENVLREVADAADDGRVTPLVERWQRAMDDQVRRDVVDALRKAMLVDMDIERAAAGWVIDDRFVLSWDGEVYYAEHPSETYTRSGASSGEPMSDKAAALELDVPAAEAEEMDFGEASIYISEKEMEFMAKAKYLAELEQSWDEKTRFIMFGDDG